MRLPIDRYKALLARIEAMCEQENAIYEEIKALDILWLIDDYYGHSSEVIEDLKNPMKKQSSS